jgi:hypothetical protein
MLTYADVCWQLLALEDVTLTVGGLLYADVCMLTNADVC